MIHARSVSSSRRSPCAGRLALAAAALWVAVSGCSSDSRVLARVGDRTITVREFRDVAATAANRYLFLPPDTAKFVLLDDLVQRELLLVAAKGHPATPDTFVARRRAEIEDDALKRALIQQLTPRDVGVSEAEVHRLRDWRATATHCQVVFTLDLASARAALQMIRNGESFGVVAQRFDPSGMLPPGGDLGFVLPGGLISPLDKVVREAPVGSLVGPIEAGDQGCFLVQILSREPRPEAAQLSEAPQLQTMLVQRKQRAALLRRYQQLGSEYRVETEPAGIAVLYDRFGTAERLRQGGELHHPPVLSAEERATVLGRWDGGPRFRGAYTLEQAGRDLEHGVGGQVNTSNQLVLGQWVRNRILQQVATIEAHRRHLDEEPEVARHIREKVNGEILEALYTSEVVSKAEPTDEEVMAAYHDHAPALAQLRSARVQMMTFPDSATAVSALEKLPRGRTLSDAVLIASPRLRVREEVVKFPSNDPIWSSLHDVLMRVPVGQVFGPVPAPDGMRIIQVVERDAPVPTFEALPQEVRAGLRESAREAARERRLREYTQELRRTIRVTIDRGLLRRIPWPAPAGLQVLSGG